MRSHACCLCLGNMIRTMGTMIRRTGGSFEFIIDASRSKMNIFTFVLIALFIVQAYSRNHIHGGKSIHLALAADRSVNDNLQIGWYQLFTRLRKIPFRAPPGSLPGIKRFWAHPGLIRPMLKKPPTRKPSKRPKRAKH